MNSSTAPQLLQSFALQQRRGNESDVQKLGIEPMIFLGVTIIIFFIGTIGAVFFARWVRRKEAKKPDLVKTQRQQEREASAEEVESYRRMVMAQDWRFVFCREHRMKEADFDLQDPRYPTPAMPFSCPCKTPRPIYPLKIINSPIEQTLTERSTLRVPIL